MKVLVQTAFKQQLRLAHFDGLELDGHFALGPAVDSPEQLPEAAVADLCLNNEATLVDAHIQKPTRALAAGGARQRRQRGGTPICVAAVGVGVEGTCERPVARVVAGRHNALGAFLCLPAATLAGETLRPAAVRRVVDNPSAILCHCAGVVVAASQADCEGLGENNVSLLTIAVARLLRVGKQRWLVRGGLSAAVADTACRGAGLRRGGLL